MPEDIAKVIVGAISAVIMLSILIPVLNQIASITQTPSFNFLNILIPLIIFMVILRIVKEVFDL